MICFNCRRQIPDDSQVCPSCGTQLIHQTQIVHEVRHRRFQRWILYAIIVVVVVVMVGYMVKIYSDNVKLMENTTKTQAALADSTKALADKDSQLAQKQTQITQLEQSLSDSQKSLTQKTSEYRVALDQKTSQLTQYEQFRVKLGTADANLYKFVVDNGVGTSRAELAKIPLADYNLAGADSDSDGLSDLVEGALGTDKSKRDTDGDGYNDKIELINGYDPLGPAKLPIDLKFAQNNKGKILIQVEQKGEAWYVSPKDGKKYFLGQPAEVLKVLEKLGSPIMTNTNANSNSNVNSNINTNSNATSTTL